MRAIEVNETIAARRRVYFQLVGLDGITPATSEGGGQPQISTNGAAWTNTDIGVLVHIGNGRYYATLAAGAVDTVADLIETRYKSSNTAECPGDTAVIYQQDPATSTRSTGTGSTAWTYTLTSALDGSPVPGAEVWVTADAAGQVLLDLGLTDSDGQVLFHLDPGTVYVWRRKAGWSFVDPDTEVVT